jgi:hypothetical protein
VCCAWAAAHQDGWKEADRSGQRLECRLHGLQREILLPLRWREEGSQEHKHGRRAFGQAIVAVHHCHEGMQNDGVVQVAAVQEHDALRLFRKASSLESCHHGRPAATSSCQVPCSHQQQSSASDNITIRTLDRSCSACYADTDWETSAAVTAASKPFAAVCWPQRTSPAERDKV